MTIEELIAAQQEYLGKGVPSGTQPKPKMTDAELDAYYGGSAPKEKPGFVSSNLKKGFATVGTALGGLAKFAGAEEMGQENVDYWKKKSAEYEQADPTMRLADINGVGDTVKFIGQQTLQMAPLAISAIPMALGGGALGAAAGLGATGIGAAGMAGATLGSIGTEAGIISSEVKPGEMDRAQILKGAIPAGILETIPELVGLKVTGLGKTAIDMLSKKYGAGVAKEVAEKAAVEGWGKRAGRVVGGLGLTGASEGMTESAQTPLETWGAGGKVFNDGQSFGDAPLTNIAGALTGGMVGGENYTPEMQSEMLESMAAGAAGGLGMGGAGHVVNYGINKLNAPPKPSAIENTTTPGDITTPEAPNLDTQIKAGLGGQMNLFDGGITPNSPEVTPFTAQDVVRTTMPRVDNEQFAGVDLGNDPTKLTEYTPTKAEEKNAIINPTLDRIFHQAMLSEIKTANGKKATDLTNPAEVESAVGKVYKRYKAIAEATVTPVEGLSTEATHNKAIENKAKAIYITKTMESSPQFKQNPQVVSALEKQAMDASKEKVTEDKEQLDLFNPPESLGTKDAPTKQVVDSENLPKPPAAPKMETTVAKEDVTTKVEKTPEEISNANIVENKDKLAKFLHGASYADIKTKLGKSEVDLALQDIEKEGGSVDEYIKTKQEAISQINKNAEEGTTTVAVEKEEEAPSTSTRNDDVIANVLARTKEGNKKEKKKKDKDKKPPVDSTLEGLIGKPKKASVRTDSERGLLSDAVKSKIISLVDKLTGGNATVEFSEDAFYRKDKQGKEVELDGETIGAFIRIVEDASSPEAIARHESIHVLRNMGVINEAEWNILKAKATGWVKKFNVKADYPNLTGDELLEEAVARAFQNGAEKSTVFTKIKEFFEKMFNFVKGDTYTSAREVFSKIESGQLGSRPFDGVIVDSFSKPAKTVEDFIRQINKAFFWNTLTKKQQDKIKHENRGNDEMTRVPKARFDFMESLRDKLQGITEPLNETIPTLHAKSTKTITFKDIEGKFDKLVKEFEPVLTKPMQESLNKLFGYGALYPIHDVTTHKSVKVPRVFNAFDAYQSALQSVVEAHSEEDTNAEFDFYNGSTMKAPLKTIGELRNYYFKYMQNYIRLKSGFETRDFQTYVDALAEFENMGFAPYRQQGEYYRFFDRTAAIKMYTFYHYGTVSEVLLPEWFIFADDSIRYNLDKYREVYDKHANMFYGMGDAAHNVDKHPIKDLVKMSQMIKDLRDNMQGKSSDVYIMNGYTPTDRNFVAMQVARVLQKFNIVSFEDKFGDSLTKDPSRFSAESIEKDIFGAIPKNASLEEFANAFAEVNEYEEQDDFEEEFGTETETATTMSGDESPQLKGSHKGSQKNVDPDILAAGIGRQPKSSTYVLAHKDDFKVTAASNAVEILLGEQSHHIKMWFTLMGKGIEYDKAVSRVKQTDNRVDFINSVISLVTEVVADTMETTVDGHVSNALVKALESADTGPIVEALERLKVDWEDTPYMSLIAKRDNVRSISGDKAPVPYSFALNHITEMLYKERSKQGGDTTKDIKSNALQKLAQIVAIHIAEYNSWPFYVAKDESIRQIMEHITGNSDKSVGTLDTVVMSDSATKQLEQLLLKELGYTTPDKTQPLYAQIQKIVAENRKKEAKASNLDKVPKRLVAERLTKLIGNLLTGSSDEYYGEQYGPTDKKAFNSKQEEYILRDYLKQISNGLRVASILKDKGERVTADVTALAELQAYLRGVLITDIDKANPESVKKRGLISKNTIDNIFRLVDSITGDYVPMINRATYTPIPTIPMGSLFTGYKGFTANKKAMIYLDWLPKINEKLSSIIGIEVNTKIVTDKQGNAHLQMFADSLGLKYTKSEKESTELQEDQKQSEFKAIVEETRRHIFAKIPDLSFTHIRQLASAMDKVVVKPTQPLGDMTRKGLETAFKKTDKGDGGIERYAEVPRNEATGEPEYIKLVHIGENSGPFGWNQVDQFEHSINKIVHKMIVSSKMKPWQIGSFVDGFVDTLTYTLKVSSMSEHLNKAIDVPVETYVHQSVDGTPGTAHFFDKEGNVVKGEDWQDTIFDAIPELTTLVGGFELPMSTYSDMITDSVKDLAQFMYGEENQPVQNIWKNKSDGTLVVAEVSLTGKLGDHMIRYYPVSGVRKNMKSMSTEHFKRQFEQQEYSAEELSTEPKDDNTLSTLTESRYKQEVLTAMREVPEKIQDTLIKLFFESTKMAEKVIKSREMLEDITKNIAENITNQELAEAVNQQAFSAEDIVKNITSLERTMENASGAKMLKASYQYPDLYKAVKSALEGLKEAGFLNPSYATGSDKMRFEDSPTAGRKYIMTKKMIEYMIDQRIKNARESEITAKASVVSQVEQIIPFLTNDGNLKNDFVRTIKQYMPHGTKELSIIRWVHDFIKVPFYAAVRKKIFMPLLLTSMRKMEFSDKFKGSYFDKALGGILVKMKKLNESNPKDYKKFGELIDYANIFNEEFTLNKAINEEGIKGISKEALDLFKELQVALEDTKVTTFKNGATAYMAKYQGIFKNEGLATLVYEKVGVLEGNLSDKEARELAKEIMPAYIKDTPWADKFVKDIVDYNGWLGTTKARMTSVKYYMPRTRKVDAVYVEVKEDKTRKVAFKYFPNREEANAWAKLAEAKDPSIFKWGTQPQGELVATVGDTDADRLKLISSLDSVQEFDEIQKIFNGGVDPDFSQPWFGNSTLSEGKAGGTPLYRRAELVIAGYDNTDVYNNYLAGFERMAQSFARLEYGLTQFGNLQAIREGAKGDEEILQDIPEFVKHLQHDLRRVTKGEHAAQEVKGVVAFMFMGFRVMSALVNSTQTIINGVPKLARLLTESNGEPFTKNLGTASKIMAKYVHMAARDVVRVYLGEEARIYDTKEAGARQKHWMGKALYTALDKTFGIPSEREKLLPEHEEALKAFSKDGIMRGMFNNLTMVDDMDDAFAVRSNRTDKLKDFVTNSLKIFQVTEIMNREGSFLAAFDHYKSLGLEYKEAYDKASEFVYGSQYMINKFNTPLAVKDMGPIGTAGYALMSFPFNFINDMYTLNADVFGQGKDKAVRVNSAKVFFSMIGVLFLLGGSGGLPFKDILELIYRMVGGKILRVGGVASTDNMDADIKRALNTMNLPEAIQHVVTDGLPSTLGFSISGNIGMRTPVIGGMLEGKDLGQSAMGASGALVKKAFDTGKYFSRGEFWKMTESASPEVVASAMRAYRMYQDGQKTTSGKPVYYQGKLVKESGGEALMMGMGLKPMSWAEKQSERTSERDIKKLWSERKQLAESSGDKDVINAFNRKLIAAKIMPLVKPIKAPKPVKPNRDSTTFETQEDTRRAY